MRLRYSSNRYILLHYIEKETYILYIRGVYRKGRLVVTYVGKNKGEEKWLESSKLDNINDFLGVKYHIPKRVLTQTKAQRKQLFSKR